MLSRNFRMFTRSFVDYIQGQAPEPRVREYFYFIDHQGMLFLDDSRMKNFTSCFKEKQFLSFFFKRLKINDSGRYSKDFPFLSLCGRERNFIRCDDLPIVFTHIIEDKKSNKELFSYAHAGESLVVPFEPDKIFMNVKTGRVYHPGPERAGGIGLICSKFSIEISSNFEFSSTENSTPTTFTWKEKNYTLNNDWYHDKINLLKSQIN